MKIAMLSVHSCPTGNLGARDTGGMSVYIRELARELGRQGHEVDVYTQDHDHADAMVGLGEGVRLIHLEAGGTSIPKQELYPSLPEFTANLEGFCRENDLRYDLVFSHYWLSGWVGRWLGHRWRVPHMVMFHTLGAVKNTLGLGQEEPALRLDTEAMLSQTGQCIIASTPREKATLVRCYGAPPERIGVVPCGVNLSRFHPRGRAGSRRRLGWGGEKTILFVGRIEPLKGLEPLLQGLSLLDGRCPRLVVIGGDESSRAEVERLQGLAQNLGLGELVTFLGRVEHDELPYFYSAADAGIVPSFYESFCLVALESLACGTPVIATDVGDLKNIIRNGRTGYVVKDNSPRLLADNIAALLYREGGTASAEAIRQSVVSYGWAEIARRITGECQRVLADYRLETGDDSLEPASLCYGHHGPPR